MKKYTIKQVKESGEDIILKYYALGFDSKSANERQWFLTELIKELKKKK